MEKIKSSTFSIVAFALIFTFLCHLTLIQCLTAFCTNNEQVASNGKCLEILSFGENCDPDLDTCNQNKFLECNRETSTCQCRNSSEYSTWYDENTDTCYRKANSVCELSPDSQKCELNAKCLPAPSTQRVRSKSMFDLVYKCLCHDELVPNSNGLCFQQYDGACSPERDLCDPVGFLSCSHDSQCKCADTETQLFQPEIQTCQILSGAHCGPSAPNSKVSCVYNASCSESGPEDFKCKCNVGFIATRNGTCALPHGADCNVVHDQCDPTILGLECNRDTAKCSCQDEENSFYDMSTKTCFLLADAMCGSTQQPFRKCIPNSHCNASPGLCTCTGTLKPNRERHCSLGYGFSCDPNNDMCDKSAYLYCNQNSVCSCGKTNVTFYDPNTETCRLVAETECSSDVRAQPCVENSSCEFSESGKLKCACHGGYVSNKKGRCFFAYEQPCNMSDTDMCDPDAFTACFDSKCQCIFSDTHYYHESQDCRRLPGGRCYESQLEPECIAGSSCDPEVKICACEDGYEESPHGSCLLGYQEICGEESGECNDGNFLECVNHSCECSAGYFPNTENKDVVDSGVRCQAGYSKPCSKNVSCHAASQLGCLSGSCGCLHPDTQIYDPVKESCVGLRGAECTTGNSNGSVILCLDNLECVAVEVNETYGTCQCKNTWENMMAQSCNDANTNDIKLRDFIFLAIVGYACGLTQI